MTAVLAPLELGRGRAAFAVDGPFPNPFNGATQLRLRLGRRQQVDIGLYNMLGQRVLQVHRGGLTAGVAHDIVVDTAVLASGLYIVRVAGEDFRFSRKITLAK